MKTIIKIFVLLLFSQSVLWAQNINRAGTSAAQFLKFGVGARASAIGEAGVTLTGDASGIFWNPASIARLDKMSVTVTRNQLYTDISYNFFGFTYPLTSNSTVGISAIFLDSGEMEVTTLDNPQGTGSYFSWESLCLGVTYSRFVTNRLSLGVSAKYIREGAFSQIAQTVAIDIGSLLDTGVLGMKLGMSLSNFGREMQLSGSSLQISHDWYSHEDQNVFSPAYLETEKWPLPLIFRLGLSTELVGSDGQLLKSEHNRIIFAADTFDPNDALLRSNFGLEYEWRDRFALRGGYRGVSLEKDDFETYMTSSYSLGAGLKYQFDFANVRIDYAFIDYQILGNGHQFTLALTF